MTEPAALALRLDREAAETLPVQLAGQVRDLVMARTLTPGAAVAVLARAGCRALRRARRRRGSLRPAARRGLGRRPGAGPAPSSTTSVCALIVNGSGRGGRCPAARTPAEGSSAATRGRRTSIRVSRQDGAGPGGRCPPSRRPAATRNRRVCRSCATGWPRISPGPADSRARPPTCWSRRGRPTVCPCFSRRRRPPHRRERGQSRSRTPATEPRLPWHRPPASTWSTSRSTRPASTSTLCGTSPATTSRPSM